MHFGLGVTLYCQGRYDEAVEHAAEPLDLFPEYWLISFLKGMALSQEGLLEESILSLEANLWLSPTFTLEGGLKEEPGAAL